MRELLRARLGPFRHRDFRNLFIAQTLSMVGTWSHDLARSWIIISATGSSGALGNLNLAIAVPCLFLILHGGVLVDRTDVRKLIQRTKFMLGISSLVLAALSEYSHLQLWEFLIFGLIEGVIVSFDSPAFQALAVRLVPRTEFQQAIALNSTNFHTSRMLGPIIAAWLMAWHGPSLVFAFDGITYFLVAAVLAGVSLKQIPMAVVNKGRGLSLREGIAYVFGNLKLRYRVMQLMLTISCVYPIMATVFRVYIKEKFNLDAHEFGTVFSFPAMGSMAGALTFAVLKPRDPSRALILGVPLVTVMLFLTPTVPDLKLSVLALSTAAFGLYLTFASLTISMQLEVEDGFRGRMSSIIGLGFSAIGPLMCFPWGHLSDMIGPKAAIWIAASLFGVGSAALALANRPAPAISQAL